MCAHADDILMTLINPNVSLPELLSLFGKCGYYSGYKLNLRKTLILAFNYKPQEKIKRLCQFKWKNNSIKYLGVQIPTIFDQNYISIRNDIKSDTNRWVLLPMNFYNNIEIIKINILPRLLYLFQSLPVEVPQKQFSEWNRIISTYIWGKQRPRIRFQDIEHSLIGIPPQALLGDIKLQKNYLKKLNTWITVPLNIWHKILKDKDVEKNA